MRMIWYGRQEERVAVKEAIMRVAAVLVVFALTILLASCSGGPADTPLGKLVGVTKQQEVKTWAGPIVAGAQETVYLLTFEGNQTIPFRAKDQDYFPLVDSSGRKFPPAVAGTPDSDGALTQKEWSFSLSIKYEDGKPRGGAVTQLQRPKVILAYVVPVSAQDLRLQVENKTYRLPEPRAFQ